MIQWLITHQLLYSISFFFFSLFYIFCTYYFWVSVLLIYFPDSTIFQKKSAFECVQYACPNTVLTPVLAQTGPVTFFVPLPPPFSIKNGKRGQTGQRERTWTGLEKWKKRPLNGRLVVRKERLSILSPPFENTFEETTETGRETVKPGRKTQFQFRKTWKNSQSFVRFFVIFFFENEHRHVMRMSYAIIYSETHNDGANCRVD